MFTSMFYPIGFAADFEHLSAYWSFEHVFKIWVGPVAYTNIRCLLHSSTEICFYFKNLQIAK